MASVAILQHSVRSSTIRESVASVKSTTHANICGWSKVDTSIEPTTSRGVNWKGLGITPGLHPSKTPGEICVFSHPEDAKKVLEHADLVAQGDADAVLERTELRTTEKQLKKLASKLTTKALSETALKARNAKE